VPGIFFSQMQEKLKSIAIKQLKYMLNNFEILAEPPEKMTKTVTKTSFYLNCTLKFVKSQQPPSKFRNHNRGIAIVGQSTSFIIPPHSDLRCSCKPCSLYRFIEEEEKCGWRVTDCIDNDNDAKYNNDLN
jgi:hypothetical protein